MLTRLTLTLFLIAATLTPAQARQSLNILVMGHDADAAQADSDTVVVARDTRVFNQVLEGLAQQLGQGGANVYDERAFTLDAFKQNRGGRSEAELLDIARAVQHPPIDAVVIFTVYAGARRLTYTTEVYARIAARIVDPRTGRRLGSFEVTSPKGWRAPVGCERDCLVEVIGKSAGMLAGDLGDLLTRQLTLTVKDERKKAQNIPARDGMHGGYTLVFSGFASDEISGIEDYLVAFNGYRQHRPIRSSDRNVAYRYEVEADSTRLSHNLRMMLARLGAAGNISYAVSDNTFTINKTEPPEGRP
jgi:hypothetical protein